MIHVEDVTTFLQNAGYEVEGDTELIETLIGVEKEYLINVTNQQEVPENLDNVWLMRTTGRYLEIKSSSGGLTGLDVEGAIKSTKVGDTEIQYDGDTSKGKLLKDWVESLRNYGDREIERFRKLSW
jgi:hypothetical protein